MADWRAPERLCNGGLGCPDGWCGKRAVSVATDETGMQCFVCASHTAGAVKLEDIEQWFQTNVFHTPLADDG